MHMLYILWISNHISYFLFECQPILLEFKQKIQNIIFPTLPILSDLAYRDQL
jgi:hypothetical protein